MNPLVLRLIGLVLILASIGAGIWYTYHSGYNRGYGDKQAEDNATSLKQSEEYIAKLKKAGEQHDKDQAIVIGLRRQLDGLRVHLPACPASAENSNGGTGLFSEKLDDAFAELQRGAGDIIERCDRLNNAARRLNGSTF